ncbi:carbohydrate binding domain-containing protein [Nonlabens xiamenensis]|uniref:hypothetical protein n=1 Tax=Nonlabens xiamenensis TaxID=2341043 RepID=UPI000F60A185|nr:hypothetical protein [Nonlabens xiamenensis]
MKTSFLRIGTCIIIFFLLYSCERELEEYDLISEQRCERDDVVPDPFVITDFECQSNIELEDVEVIRNPSKTGINLSSFVGRYTDGQSPTDALTINFDNGLDLSTNALFKFKVKTAVTGTLRLDLLGGNAGDVTLETTIDGDQRWNEYEFDLIDYRNENFSSFQLIFNEGVSTSGSDEYLLDDLKFDPTIDPCEGVATDPSILNDFDCQQNQFLGADPTMSSVELVDNPFPQGINTSAHVGVYTDDGTQPFDNLQIVFDNPVDLSQNAVFSLKVYSTTAGPLIAKLEGGNTPLELTTNITALNQWVEYSFNFTPALNEGNNVLTLFFNAGGTMGAATDVYLIDDLRLEEFVDPCQGVTADLSIISDFECQQNYTLGLNPALISTVPNPDDTGINPSPQVGRYLEDGTQPFDNLLIDLGTPVDLSATPIFSIKILSSMAGPVIAKLEGGTTPLELTQDITVLNDWVEYSFDFSSVTGAGNDQLVIFFNAGQMNGTTQDIYFLDDLRFEADPCSEVVADCTGVAQDLKVINDFDCQQNYNMGNGAGINDAPTVQNPMVSCNNRSSNVGEYTDDGTMPFDNLFIPLNGPFDLTNNSTFSMDILTSNPTPLTVLAKLEGGTPVEVMADVTVTDEWQELTFDFSGAIGNRNTALVLFFNAGQANGSPADLYYIDNMRFE